MVLKMIKLQVFHVLTAMKRKFIEQLKPETMINHDKKSFTRKRKLDMRRLTTIILRCSPKALQEKLDDFFEEIGHKEEVVSKQAFSKARTNLDPSVLRKSFEMTAEILSSCEDLTLYKNKYRLCAIDGSTIVLDNASELLNYFGGSGSNHDCVSALASICYDPLNDIILDGQLHPYSHSERAVAVEHFNYVETLPLPSGVTNLFTMDRGYGSKELIADMIDRSHHFILRVRDKFNLDIDNASNNQRVSFKVNNKHYEVRVFKILLNSGVVETLITNLEDGYMSSEEAGELYFNRWKVETKFDILKNKLELENMSGRRVITTFQDFWAKLDIANTVAALKFCTDEQIETNMNPENKYAQTTNQNRLISKFSQRYIELLLSNDLDAQLALFDELVSDISRRPVEVKPDRSFVRKKPKKKKFSDRHRRPLS